MLQEKLEYNGIEHHIMVHLKKGYESITRSILYNILSNFGTLMELVRLIKMCLNDTHSNVWKHMSDLLLVQKGLKQVNFVSPFISTLP